MPNPTAADMMTRKLVILTPETDIYEAIHTLVKKGISGAPVVDAEGQLMGVLSEYDCLKVMTAGAYDGLPEGKVADYMTCPATTIRPESSIFDVVTMFLNHPIRRIPVMDATGQLQGMVSRRDVLVAIESMRDNSRLYGSKEEEHYPPSAEDARGVTSAMRDARGMKKKETD